MEVEPGKLFIGGISWDTNDGRLKDYFQTYGDVVEAVIMKDRNTGRARGFGFVVFADASIAEKVLKEKHVIDGRMVEAKKAVPRDDQTTVVRNSSSSSIHGSPGPAVRTKKIFVGGLAPNVTESEFKKYFDQFGTITDVVVMYDHNTQRPRGFGFITFDSEEAVDKVLVKIFHELSGKMVEVKRAVPKELSPGPNRSPLSGYNSYGMSSRVSSLLNTYVQGQGGLRIDGRLSPITIGRNGYPPFSPTGYGMSLNFEPGLNNTPFGLNGNLSGGSNANFGYGRAPNSYYGGSSSSIRYNGNGSAPPAAAAAALSSPNRSMWLNGGQNVDELIGSGMGNNMGFGNIGTIWGSGGGGGGGSSTMSGHGGINAAVSNYNNSGNNGFLGSSGMDIGYRRNNSFPSGGDGVQGRFGNLYGGDGSSMYLDSTWRLPPSLEFDVSGGGSFGYGSENLGSNVVASNSSVGYIGDYNVSNRSTRGIAT